MTKQVVRLHGEDHTIARVVSEAGTMIPATADPWVQRVAGLARMREDIVRRMAAAGGEPRSRSVDGDQQKRPTFWWVMYSIGVALAFAGEAGMLPPKGPGDQDPVIMMTFGNPAIVVGAAVILLLALLPLPRGVRGTQSAVALAVIVILVSAFASVLNITRMEPLLEAVGSTSVAIWAGGTVVAVVASALIILRIRSGVPERRTTSQSSSFAVTEARKLAHGLARELPYNRSRPGDTERSWNTALDGLAREVDAEAIEQARQLGPFGYIVWAYYDGETELPRLGPLRRR